MSAYALTPLNIENENLFFGFHDLVAWNSGGDKILALRIDDMRTPPDGIKPIDTGFIKAGEFIKLGSTLAYNYPQGARQQWIGDSNTYIINDRGTDTWISKVYDTEALKLVKTLKHPTHVITNDGWAFGIDYARLHRVGGYGYTGLADKNAANNAPADAGIIKHNIYTEEATLLVSIKDIANFETTENIGQHHYITHLLLNPKQDRIAFLHRYKLKDGGETTRLMTIGTNGEGLRCLSAGFLSHFDWKDDNSVLIWGRTGSNIEKLRGSLIYRLLPSGFIFYAKKIIKSLRKKGNKTSTGNSGFNWLLISDDEQKKCETFAAGKMTEDGHPMVCPANRDWLVCDTYPNEEGIRQLYLYQYSTNNKIELGRYKMIDDKPDISKAKNALSGIDPEVLKAFSIEKMAFYRSGLHCDLHPRWKGDGTAVAFDSIHEGKRLIYSFDVSEYLNIKTS
ncbi:hypothetical protein [Mucilaginibacter sp.]|uniref:hypothetical protein n=1 Tax=Mucilaginibacter sp. TaxID=1882438 RepID=UPI003D0F0AAF